MVVPQRLGGGLELGGCLGTWREYGNLEQVGRLEDQRALWSVQDGLDSGADYLPQKLERSQKTGWRL